MGEPRKPYYKELINTNFGSTSRIVVDVRTEDGIGPDGQPLRWRTIGECAGVFMLPTEDSGSDGVVQMICGQTQRLHWMTRSMVLFAVQQDALADALDYCLEADPERTLDAIQAAGLQYLRQQIAGLNPTPEENDGNTREAEPRDAGPEGATGQPGGGDPGDVGPRSPAPDEGAEEGPLADGDGGPRRHGGRSGHGPPEGHEGR